MANSNFTSMPIGSSIDLDKILEYVESLPNPETRLGALIELEKYKDYNTVIAPIVWNTFGCVAALIQELVTMYQYLAPPSLNQAQSTRLGVVLCIFQGLASHPETRPLFIKANIAVLLYPYLNLNHASKSCEYIRLTTLAVITSLIRVDEPEVLSHLLSTDIFNILARIMESSNELGKTVSTYSFMRILSSNEGLHYVCANYQRLSYAIVVLGKMVYCISKNPSFRSQKLLKHILNCYNRLLDESNSSRLLLIRCLPDQLLDPVFYQIIGDDENSKPLLTKIISCMTNKSEKIFQSAYQHKSFLQKR